MAISPNEYDQKIHEEIELDSAYAIVQLPTSAVEVTISAKVYVNGEIKTVQNLLNMKAIQSAIREAEDNYISEDAVFTLTDKGREYAERIINGQD